MKLDWVKALTDETEEQILPPTPSFQEMQDEFIASLSSKYDRFSLSFDQGTTISEEDRASHFHIIGGIGQGKSKFLEYLIRHDIDRLHKGKDGIGLCFLDGSEGGATMRSVLSYCAEIGYEKVLVIDPRLIIKSKKTPAINPFKAHYDNWDASIDYMVDAFRTAFEVEDDSRTNVIRNYLTMLFAIFHFCKLPPADLLYFSSPPPDKYDTGVLLEYAAMRNSIFAQAKKAIKDGKFPNRWRRTAKKYIADIENAYKNPYNFSNDIITTARRLNSFARPSMQEVFSHREGVDFYELVAKGWIILVNLHQRDFGRVEARLLGTAIINQIIHSINILIEEDDGKYNKPYYLYIDEAGDYVTDTLADVLEKQRKIGLRCVLAHQNLGQLRIESVRKAIVNHTDIKCAFYISNQEEREKVFRLLGYGGDLKPEEAAWNMQSQKKQEMVIRLNKQLPKKITVPFVPDPKVDKADVDKFIEKIFSHPWYKTSKEISNDVADRIRKDTTHPHRTTQPDPGADNKHTRNKPRDRQDNPQKDVGQRSDRANSNAQPDVAWESLFLEDQGNEGAAD